MEQINSTPGSIMVKDTLLTTVYTSLLITIFSEWLADKGLGFLDVSYSNHELRPLLLNILSQCNVPGRIVGLSFFRWVALRGMRIKNFELKQYHKKRMCSNLQSILSRTPFLINLTITYCSNFLTIIKACKLYALTLYGSVELTDSAFQSALPFLDSLHEVELLECSRLTDFSLSALSQHCPRLRKFIMSSTKFTSAGLSVVAEKCDLEVFHSGYIDIATFRAVVTSSPSLTSINIGHCKEFGDDEIKMLADCCPKLQEVDFGFLNVADSTIVGLVSTCVSITHLNFFCCSISNLVLEEVGKCLPRLTYLNLAENDNVTDDGVIAVARGCSQLRFLYLSGVTKLTDLSVSTVVERCPRLEELFLCDLINVTDAGLMRIWDKCPLLRSLHTVDTSATDVILVACCASANCNGRGLEFLIVRHSDCGEEPTFTRESPDVFSIPGSGMNYTQSELLTEGRLKLILHHNPQLRQLHLEDCLAVTDEVVEACARNCPMLEYVTLHLCSRVGVAGVESLASHSKQLIAVYISNIDSVTDDLLLRLVTGRKYFKMLGLDACSGYSDDGIIAVVDACPGLKELTIRYCQSITNRSILYALRHCSALHKLIVSDCTHLTALLLFEMLQIGRSLLLLDIKGCTGISPSEVEEFFQGPEGPQIEDFKYV